MFCIFFHYFYNSSPPAVRSGLAASRYLSRSCRTTTAPSCRRNGIFPVHPAMQPLIRLYGKTETSPPDSSRLQI